MIMRDMSTFTSTPSSSSTASTQKPRPDDRPLGLESGIKHDLDCDGLQIFLGGSCNPTTWRQKLAIPFLEANGISYYNPQVDNWTPEVVHVERCAKENAQTLLFVIDRQTRSAVSIVESAYMASENKKLVLVVYPFDYDVVSGETISFVEYHELKEARRLLQSLMIISRVPMFPELIYALDYISKKLSNDSQLTFLDGLVNFSQELVNLEEDSARGESQTSSDSSEGCLKDIYFSLDGDEQTSIEVAVTSLLTEKGLTYSFASVNSVLGSSRAYESVVQANAIRGQQYDQQYEQIESCGEEMARKSSNEQKYQNVNTGYLTETGSVDNRKIASEPNDLNSRHIGMIRAAIEKEIRTIKSSRVVLFVITSKCRGLSIMVLASYFMALFRQNVVLCVEYLKEPCLIGEEVLTKSAIADYNRGRVYLCDYAVKSCVPVFSSIKEAVEYCIKRCMQREEG